MFAKASFKELTPPGEHVRSSGSSSNSVWSKTESAMPKIQPRVPRGMRDILPQKMLLRQYVVAEIERVFQRFGFEPLQTPVLELRETLMGKYGQDAEKLIYDAQHREGKENSRCGTISRSRSRVSSP